MQNRRPITAWGYGCIPWALILLGFVIMAGAFLFIAGNALPYQDPTPELLAYQAAEASKGNWAFVAGLLTTATGGCWIWLRSRARRLRKAAADMPSDRR